MQLFCGETELEICGVYPEAGTKRVLINARLKFVALPLPFPEVRMVFNDGCSETLDVGEVYARESFLLGGDVWFFVLYANCTERFDEYCAAPPDKLF